MRRDSWRSILETRTTVDQMVASAFGDHPNLPPVAAASTSTTTPYQTPQWQELSSTATRRSVTEVPGTAASGQTQGTGRSSGVTATELDLQAMADLRARVKARVDALCQDLQERELPQVQGREEAMEAVLYYFDERIMDRLPAYLQISWSLLQTDRTGRNTGGDDFYTNIDELLDNSTTPSFVFELYYFCLAGGFVGQYADDPQKIEHYENLLRQSITIAQFPVETSDTAKIEASTKTPRPTWVPFAVAVLSVVLITAAYTVLSNY